MQPSAPHKEHNATTEPHNLVAMVKDLDVKQQVQTKTVTPADPGISPEQAADLRVEAEIAETKASYAKGIQDKENAKKEKGLM